MGGLLRSTLLALGLALCAPAQAAPEHNHASATPVTISPRGFPQLMHVGIIVKDIEKATDEVLAQYGLDRSAIVTRNAMKDVDSLYLGKNERISAEFSIIDLGNSQIELIQPLTGTSPYSDALKMHPEGIAHHVAFAVPSINAQLAKARTINPDLKVVLDATVGKQVRWVYVDGVIPGILVEYIEMLPPQ